MVILVYYNVSHCDSEKDLLLMKFLVFVYPLQMTMDSFLSAFWSVFRKLTLFQSQRPFIVLSL